MNIMLWLDKNTGLYCRVNKSLTSLVGGHNAVHSSPQRSVRHFPHRSRLVWPLVVRKALHRLPYSTDEAGFADLAETYANWEIKANLLHNLAERG
jgi:hypothetical protein